MKKLVDVVLAPNNTNVSFFLSPQEQEMDNARRAGAIKVFGLTGSRENTHVPQNQDISFFLSPQEQEMDKRKELDYDKAFRRIHDGCYLDLMHDQKGVLVYIYNYYKSGANLSRMEKLMNIRLAANGVGALFYLEESVGGGNFDKDGASREIIRGCYQSLNKDPHKRGSICYISLAEYDSYKKEGKID
jgi:hypothetical protein